MEWDYHVILVSRAAGADWEVWDLDTYCPLPESLPRYVAATFTPEPQLPLTLRPRFRVVDGAEYLATFSSTRAHMRRRNGSYRKPPPPWPPITGGTVQLPTWLDVKGHPDRWNTLGEWLAAFTEPPAPSTAR